MSTSLPISQRITRLWQTKSLWLYGLRPLAALYCGGMQLRRRWYRSFGYQTRQLRVPVIVVGNITVGGTGKTPLVIALVEWLQQRGYYPGVVSRGYGGRANQYPQLVYAESQALVVGDEPLLIHTRTRCPVAVAPDRLVAAQILIKQGCTVIISDDGLQHYRLPRDVEIAVLDGERRLGNGWCLPAGPLREPAHRLTEVDLIVTNGQPQEGEYGMQLILQAARCLAEPYLTQPVTSWQGKTVHAVAGIGNPTRFFRQLETLGITVVPHIFPDHHAYIPEDLNFPDDLPILMTEKDAVKCQTFAEKRYWSVPVTAACETAFWQALARKLAD